MAITQAGVYLCNVSGAPEGSLLLVVTGEPPFLVARGYRIDQHRTVEFVGAPATDGEARMDAAVIMGGGTTMLPNGFAVLAAHGPETTRQYINNLLDALYTTHFPLWSDEDPESPPDPPNIRYIQALLPLA